MIHIQKNDRSTINTFFGYIISTFFFLFPFITTNYFLYGPTTLRSLNLILMVGMLGIICSIWLFNKRNLLTFNLSPIFLAGIGYIAIYLISGLQGLSFENTFWSLATRMTGLWYLINLGILTLFISNFFDNEKKLKRLILLITVSTAIYSLCSFVGYEGLGWIFLNVQNDAFTFGNSTFAGMYIFGVFILSIYYLYQSTYKKWWMYAVSVALVINPYILNKNLWFGEFGGGLVGEARASAYMLLFSLPFLACIWGVSKIKNHAVYTRVVYSLFSLGIIITIVSAFSLLSSQGGLRDVYMKGASGARPLVWEMSGTIISEKPLLGFGPDNFERVYESHYNNKILESRYGGEAWFDRAHNIFIDTLVDTGALGLVSYGILYLTIIFCLVLVTIKSNSRDDRVFAAFLITYFVLHLGELQTAFDTSISYPIIAVMVASTIILFGRLYTSGKMKEIKIIYPVQIAMALGLFLFCSWSLIAGWLPVWNAQIANGKIRTVGSAEKRIPEYEILFNSPVDLHALLWRTTIDFERGIAENPRVLENPDKVSYLKKEIETFEQSYKEYLKKNPTHFRAMLNLADVLIYQRLFGVDKLKEAQDILDQAIALVPEAPQSYWMKSVAYLYMRKFDLAREYAKKSLDLNPNIQQSQNLVIYIENSIKSFPEIDLYIFKQI